MSVSEDVSVYISVYVSTFVRVYVSASVCTFKLSPCVPAKRPRALSTAVLRETNC